MRVSLDLESTLASFMPLFLDRVFQDYGVGCTIYDVDNWDWAIQWGGDYFVETLDDIWENSWEFIPPTESSLPDVTKKLTQDFEVDVVTSHVGVEEEMGKWLSINGIHYDDFISTDEQKETLGYDIYIDDYPGLPAEITNNQELYLPKKPWNRDVWLKKRYDNVFPVGSVYEASDMILRKYGN